MQQAPLLKFGDTIYILSTARKMTLLELQPSISIIESWGLKVMIGQTIGAEENQFAGNDQLRSDDFNHAVHHPEVKAILCARGGYGTVRIVDHLDWNALQKNLKWIIGYSDVTTIHSHANRMGLQTLHATMPVNFSTNSEESLSTLKEALFTGSVDYADIQLKHLRPGRVDGEVVGGNLSILYSLLGSPSSINTKGKILFIEDLDEYLYHIDRMMMNLKRNGYFSKLKGLIIGGMSDMNDNAIPFGKPALEIIMEHVEEYDFPVVYDFPVGHLDDNRAIIVGSKITL
jgi:muramoyltetrapeptide carboxypeptidase